jgi:hypothetical protein
MLAANIYTMTIYKEISIVSGEITKNLWFMNVFYAIFIAMLVIGIYYIYKYNPTLGDAVYLFPLLVFLGAISIISINSMNIYRMLNCKNENECSFANYLMWLPMTLLFFLMVIYAIIIYRK